VTDKKNKKNKNDLAMISLRVTPAQKNLFRQAARLIGVSLSGLIRLMLLEKVKELNISK